jgi:c-di-GMP-binding flagellar brake protein YcgR
MDPVLTQPSSSSDVPDDRRRYKRYRLATPISIRAGGGPEIPAMTLEISEGGLSAVLASPVEIGDTVELQPVAATTVSAQVRHQVGKVYGFEFLQLTPEQVNSVRDICQKLPLFPRNRMGI